VKQTDALATYVAVRWRSASVKRRVRRLRISQKGAGKLADSVFTRQA